MNPLITKILSLFSPKKPIETLEVIEDINPRLGDTIAHFSLKEGGSMYVKKGEDDVVFREIIKDGKVISNEDYSAQ